MKKAIVASAVAGAILGSFLTYGLTPFPRIYWTGHVNGVLHMENAILPCVGFGAYHGAHVEISGNAVADYRFCPGFLRSDSRGGAYNGGKLELPTGVIPKIPITPS